MDKIDWFDKYRKGELTGTECSEFEDRLSSDKNLATDYEVYRMTVDGIRREAEQDDLEFGAAMKVLTKEQLGEIIGSRQKDRESQEAHAAQKAVGLRSWMWPMITVAAVVVVAFSAVLQIEKQSRETVDEAIYACNVEELVPWRSGGEQWNLTELDAYELKAKLPEIMQAFESTTDEQEMADTGYTLVIVYIRLHQRDQAKEVLNQLITRFDGNEAYRGFVKKCKSLLDLLQ